MTFDEVEKTLLAASISHGALKQSHSKSRASDALRRARIAKPNNTETSSDLDHLFGLVEKILPCGSRCSLGPTDAA